MTINSKIRRLIEIHEFSQFGFTTLARPLSMDLYKNWLHHEFQGDMDYLKAHEILKENPSQGLKARSAIVFAIPYYPHPWPADIPIKASPVALYAQGHDYHREIPRIFEPLLKNLKDEFPSEEFAVATDSGPILERDLAYKAGLGWIGKNTCLIHRKAGSLFFIAEIITTLDLKNTSPWNPDFCGQCNRCVEACPTSALSSQERRLDPSLCISYWTIEAKTLPPENLRHSIGEWLFGCDICQTVCPWNQKTLKEYAHQADAETILMEKGGIIEGQTIEGLTIEGRCVEQRSVDRIEKKSDERVDGQAERKAKGILDKNAHLQQLELKWILSSSRKELARALKSTALSRSAGWKLQRNAILMAVRSGYRELKPLIEAHLTDPKLSELCVWALQKL